MFGDEASFWLDGTLFRTWSRVGAPPPSSPMNAMRIAFSCASMGSGAAPPSLWSRCRVTISCMSHEVCPARRP